MAQTLSQLEVLALLALARLGDDAYGVTVREEIATVTGRDVSMAAIYAALDRLERSGLVRPWQSEPRPERGGRARRHFALTAAGRVPKRAAELLNTKPTTLNGMIKRHDIRPRRKRSGVSGTAPGGDDGDDVTDEARVSADVD